MSDTVELKGGLFDLMGVSSDTQTRKREPKVAARSGLVLPPVADRLPEPGEEPSPQTADVWPMDDDGRKVQAAAELDRQQAEFCKKEKMKEQLDPSNVAKDGPKGPCTPTLFRALSSSKSQ